MGLTGKIIIYYLGHKIMWSIQKKKAHPAEFVLKYFSE